MTIELPSGPLAALQAGAHGAPAVLLVPGYTGSKEDFGPVLDPIAAAGLYVTSIDLPGQYESPGPADPAGYTTDAPGAGVREMAAGLGPRVHLLGHSFGGLVARAAVIAEPSAFADLVLMGSGPAALEGERRLRLEQLAPVFAAMGTAGVYAAMQAVDSAAPGYTSPPAALAQFLERRFLAGSPAMLQGMADALRLNPTGWKQLPSGITCLVITGRTTIPGRPRSRPRWHDGWARSTSSSMQRHTRPLWRRWRRRPRRCCGSGAGALRPPSGPRVALADVVLDTWQSGGMPPQTSGTSARPV